MDSHLPSYWTFYLSIVDNLDYFVSLLLSIAVKNLTEWSIQVGILSLPMGLNSSCSTCNPKTQQGTNSPHSAQCGKLIISFSQRNPARHPRPSRGLTVGTKVRPGNIFPPQRLFHASLLPRARLLKALYSLNRRDQFPLDHLDDLPLV